MKTNYVFKIPVKLALSLVIFSFPTYMLSSCGTNDNIFSSATKKDNKDKGKSALQNGDYAGAAKYLKDYIARNPKDYQARSMLATALLKESNIDELQLAGKITDASKSGGSSDWNSIVSVMPEGTAKNIDNLQTAVTALSAIPEAQRTKEQNFQLAVASASLAVTVVKKSVADTNGTYNPTDENIAKMSDAEASLVVQNIGTTATSATSAEAGGDGVGKLVVISENINAQEGATDKEKLAAYLKTKR